MLAYLFGMVSLEDMKVDNKVKKELEFTIYAKVKNLADLDGAPKEIHEQWSVPLPDSGGKLKMRIRAVDNNRFILTTKKRRSGIDGSDEVETIIGKDMFNHLKDAGGEGYLKTRFFFPVPNSELTWEIDRFMKNGGAPSEWVKIDLEVDDLHMDLPPLPIDVEMAIIAGDPQLTAEEEEIIRGLWSNEWQQINAGPVNLPAV